MWISRMTIVLVLLLVVLLFLLMMYFSVGGARKEEKKELELILPRFTKASDEAEEISEIKSGKDGETNAPFELSFKPYCKGCVKCDPCINGYYGRYANGVIVHYDMSISCKHIQECEYIRGLK